MKDLRFDWTVNLGHLISIGFVFMSAVSVYASTMVRINHNDYRISRLEELDARVRLITTKLESINASLAVIQYQLRNEGHRPSEGNINSLPGR